MYPALQFSGGCAAVSERRRARCCHFTYGFPSRLLRFSIRATRPGFRIQTPGTLLSRFIVLKGLYSSQIASQTLWDMKIGSVYVAVLSTAVATCCILMLLVSHQCVRDLPDIECLTGPVESRDQSRKAIFDLNLGRATSRFVCSVRRYEGDSGGRGR